jgi:endonuclease-3
MENKNPEKTPWRLSDQARASNILSVLKKDFPGVKTTLLYNNPLELLIATILSAQCTDEKVNEVSKVLFNEYKTTRDFSVAPIEKLEALVRPTGFYKNKARNIKNCCTKLLKEFDGQVPTSMEKLISLDGVGRKTANVVLGNAFGIPAVIVDTHFKRVSKRLGITVNTDPDKIEFDIMKLLPKRDWTKFSYLIINHGKKTCKARRPLCSSCSVRDLCPSREDLSQQERAIWRQKFKLPK